MSATPAAAVAADLQGFFHIRIVIGLVTGLSITRMLTGLARFVQHPARNAIYPAHLVWVGFLLLYVIHFWWFQFGLLAVPHWRFEDFLFVLGYAALIFFIASILFPDSMDGYAGFADYFHSRQTWFYSLLALLFVVDLADTLLKGREHFLSFGLEYPVRQTVLICLALVAMAVADRRYHLAFASAALLAEIWWIFTQFRFLA